MLNTLFYFFYIKLILWCSNFCKNKNNFNAEAIMKMKMNKNWKHKNILLLINNMNNDVSIDMVILRHINWILHSEVDLFV